MFSCFFCPSVQIHKQAPPLEDISEDCSLAMRGLLERALERVPSLRSSATELLHEEALHPSREDQPRCWSLDSALGDSTHPLLRQHSQMTDSTQGKCLNAHTCTSCQSSYLHSFTFSYVVLDSSTLYTEDSGPFKRKRSLYLDFGALADYCKFVRGPPTAEYG